MMAPLFFVVMFLLANSLAFAQQLETAEVGRADEIITGYTRNQLSLDKYCVSMKIEHVLISHIDPSKSYERIIWQTIASNAAQKAKRIDDSRTVNNQEGLPVPVTSSVFYVKNKAVSRTGRRLGNNYDLDSSDISEGRFSLSALRIDPWELPFASVVLFREYSNVIDTRPSYRDTLTTSTLIGLKEDVNSVQTEFLVDKKNNIFKRVVFDKKCDNLPVDCRVFYKGEKGEESVLSICTTTWGKSSVESVFLPLVVNFSSIVGNPSQPSYAKNFSLELYWVLGDDLSEKTFYFEGEVDFVTAAELREAVLENHATVTPMRSTLVR